MSNLAPLKANPQSGLPTPPSGDTIAQFATYAEAQRAVDYLSDQHFPVQAVTIVGVDLKMVERVTGRLTYARAAMAGFISGAWFGLMVGLLLSIFSSSNGFSVPAAIIVGGAFGLLFAVISYAATGGRRDFTSPSQIVAGEYRVLCLTEQAGKAIQLLNQLSREGGPTSRGSGPTAGATVTEPTPATPVPTYGTPPGTETPAEPVVAVSGPTYSEMIDKKKAEDRERAAAESASAAAAAKPAEPAPAETKQAETAPAETKQAETAPAETKQAETAPDQERTQVIPQTTPQDPA